MELEMALRAISVYAPCIDAATPTAHHHGTMARAEGREQWQLRGEGGGGEGGNARTPDPTILPLPSQESRGIRVFGIERGEERERGKR